MDPYVLVDFKSLVPNMHQIFRLAEWDVALWTAMSLMIFLYLYTLNYNQNLNLENVSVQFNTFALFANVSAISCN